MTKFFAAVVLSWTATTTAGAQVSSAFPQPATPTSQTWAVHAQATFVVQGAFAFPAAYTGANSLPPGGQTRETFDATLYAGMRPWRGAEVWLNPEIDQGFGLARTVGFAGFPSAEAYKVGASSPYIRLQRLFLRQTVNLGGPDEPVAPDQNILGDVRTCDHLTLWAGKFQVTDVFDTNAYAHDPRRDFLNWTAVDAGTFDYAADAWGYTYGLAGEAYRGPWAFRLGLFDLSRVPNGQSPDDTFTEFQLVAEGEQDFQIAGRPGQLKLTGYDSRARMGDFADALRRASLQGDDATPNVLAVLRYHGHAGASLDLQQQVNDDLGVFLRAGYADGHQQSYEFADIDRTVSAGAALTGGRWGRPSDTVGVAAIANDISRDFKTYLAAGGLGLLIGDGALVRSDAEEIAETYYSAALTPVLALTLDYQFVDHPAYDAARGPVSVLAVRLHAAM